MGRIIIDADRALLGRLASYAAKKALEGEEIIILNAEKAVISGTKERVLEEVKRKLATRTLGSLEKSPTHPRRPDVYLRRVIRGMLPWKKPKGKIAYKRVKVFIGVPEEYLEEHPIRVEEADSSKLKAPKVFLTDLVKEIGGWKNR
ncbi:MAG: 50S ribosomal protein L13 [Candidatus Bathyarchaeia archaeon]